MAEQTGETGGLEAARTQFEQWSSSRSRKSPIPDELWKLAINAGGKASTGPPSNCTWTPAN